MSGSVSWRVTTRDMAGGGKSGGVILTTAYQLISINQWGSVKAALRQPWIPIDSINYGTCGTHTLLSVRAAIIALAIQHSCQLPLALAARCWSVDVVLTNIFLYKILFQFTKKCFKRDTVFTDLIIKSNLTVFLTINNLVNTKDLRSKIFFFFFSKKRVCL